MLKKITLFLIPFLLLLVLSALAQTPRQVIVEHFTNTRCSICASKNPGFYSLLHGNYPEILHIAYHPSAPYSNCYFSLQNPTENNSRTNYYGVYGSTPRAVIQGKVIPIKTPLMNSADFDAELNQLSPFSLKVTMTEIALDSIEVRITITTTAIHTYSSLDLYAAITEDSILYNASNGENLHFDVFRKQLFSNANYLFTAPQIVGDSVVITGSLKVSNNWQKQQISLIAMVQEPTTKFILQAAKQSQIETLQLTNSVEETNDPSLVNVYPNPATDVISWAGIPVEEFTIYSLSGQLLKEIKGNYKTASVSELTQGIYFLLFKTTTGSVFTKRIIVTR